MALYFFHLCDGGDTLLDPEGREIEDSSRLAVLALRDARSILSQEVLRGHIDLDCFIQVRDKAGQLVHELRFRDALTIRGANQGTAQQ
jgi:hypothetical protein